MLLGKSPISYNLTLKVIKRNLGKNGSTVPHSIIVNGSFSLVCKSKVTENHFSGNVNNRSSGGRDYSEELLLVATSHDNRMFHITTIHAHLIFAHRTSD